MDYDRLRALVARMEEDVALAARPTATDENRLALSQSWAALLTGLDVPPSIAKRACPRCGREIVRAATLCGYCWTRSTDGDHA